MLQAYLDKHPLAENILFPPPFPYPAFECREAWEALPKDDRDDLLRLAEELHQEPYPMLTASRFLAFTREGSRTAWEAPYFLRRKKLIAAVMHVCITGTLEELDEVVNGLWCILEETDWVISAHNGGRPLPDDEHPVIDLFSAQTAMILALSIRLIGRQVETVSTLIVPRVVREINRRILMPFMTHDDYGWMGFHGENLCNWTPWIVSNVMMTACAVATDQTALAGLLTRCCSMLDRYLDSMPEDGGCDEGAGYWNMAGGALLDGLLLLERVTAGRMTFWQNEKLRNVLTFPVKAWLHGPWFINFADCDAQPFLCGERLERAGEKLNDAALMALGAGMRSTPSYQLCDVPHFSRLLDRLFHPSTHAQAEAAPKDVWFPDLQVRIFEHDGFLLSAKGGNNGESHNHNDVGSFIFHVDGEPIVVDAGNMTYTAKTFSEARYTLWNTRSAYHNVPLIAGREQLADKAFTAQRVERLPDGLALDMAKAYDPPAGVLTALRRMTLNDNGLTVADTIELDSEAPVTWTFLLRYEPKPTTGGFSIGPVKLETDRDWQAETERLTIDDPRMARNWPGYLWRFTLTAKPSKHHKRIFNFKRKEGGLRE